MTLKSLNKNNPIGMFKIIRKEIVVVSALLSVLLLSSCNTQNPETIAVSYCQLKNGLEQHKAYELLSNEDKEYKSLDQFTASSQNAKAEVKAIMEKLQNTFNYKAISVEGEDTLSVSVEVTEPNVKLIMGSVFSLGDAFSMFGKSEEEALEILMTKLDKYLDELDEIPTETSTKIVRLIKEDGQLKVYENFALPVRKKEASEKIAEAQLQLNHEAAKKIIDNFNSKYQVEYFQDELEQLESIVSRKVNIGNSIKIGSLEITPKSVSVSNLNYFKQSYKTVENKVTDEKCLILKYTVKNVSKGQVFNPNDFYTSYSYNFV